MTRPLLAVLAALAGAAALAPGLAAPATAQAEPHVRPRASLVQVERQLMCVTCKVALDESESPQANSEREFIKELIAEGDDEAQIKRAMVAQFGPTVLALPGAHGFDLAVYVVPVAVVLALLAVVLALLPRWRARARAGASARMDATRAGALDPTDAARLESDLARFD